MLDKTELLTSGKHFGRVFLDYLCNHEKFQNGRGGIKQTLADELLAIGQAEGKTEKESISINNVRNWRDGAHKIPFWVNHCALVLASELGFKVTHPVDAIAIVATVLVDYTDTKQVNLDGLFIYIEQKYSITIDDAYRIVIEQFLIHKSYSCE